MHKRKNLVAFERTYLNEVAACLEAQGAEPVRDAAVQYGRNLIENGYPVVYDVDHLAMTVGVPRTQLVRMSVTPERFYAAFRLKKRRGGSRLIEAPYHELKMVQHWLQSHVTRRLPVHDACHGFRRGCSIVTNATLHADQEYILKFDVRDFFASVPQSTVFRTFRRAGYTPIVANMMAGLTTLNEALPQGAPTSPDLANVAAFRLDARLAGLATRHGLTYTRYADDLTFSGAGLAQRAVQRTIGHIMRDCGFRPNEDKTALLTRASQQRVTGIVVNEKPAWPRVTRRWLRQEVYYLTRYGVESHIQRRGYQQSAYKEYLFGHLYALRQLHPAEADAALAAVSRLAWPY